MKKKAKKKTKTANKAKKILNHKKAVVTHKSGIMPLNDRVLLKPLTEEEINTTKSGIIIPDTVSKEKPEQGSVMAVGEGRWENGKRLPLSVKVGDRVVFLRYGYDEVKLNGVEYYVLKEENILAIIQN